MARSERSLVGTVGQDAYVWQILSEVAKSFKLSPIGLTNNADQVCKSVRTIANKSDVVDRELFVRLESAIASDVECKRLVDQSTAANLMLDIAHYYENVGESDQALILGLKALSYAENAGALDSQRRAHSFVGALFARLLDFHCACTHMQQAYLLSRKIGDGVAEFATLANTVAVLEMMGLLSAAKELALKLALHQPKGTEKLDYLHVSNASNGLRISHLLNDPASADIFYHVAVEATRKQSPFTNEITKAHYDAARIVYLASRGELSEAERLASNALTHRSAKVNVKVKGLLVCAQAFVHIKLGCAEKIRNSSEKAVDLLKGTSKLADLHEELLRTLVKLHTAQYENKDQLKEAVVYLRLLGTHSLAVKHKQFFMNTSLHIDSDVDRKFLLEDPAYLLPSWISGTDDSNENQESVSYEFSTQRRDVPFDIQELNKLAHETEFRTPAFNVAENWAVAAEFAGGGTGQHCFNVGKIAAAVARRLRFARRDVVRLELACRLHDIGRVLAFSKGESSEARALGMFSSSCEHTINGARLLSSSRDETLMLAACIAKSHHEWWNGCGYPTGLRGEDIPLVGRICAIADVFASMVHGHSLKQRWNANEAIMQIHSMSGVQIDPNLVLPLIEALTELGHGKDKIIDSGHVRFNKNQLIKSKKDLYSILELVD